MKSRLVAALAFLLLLLIGIAAFALSKPRSAYWRGRTFSLQTQSLKGGAFSEDRLWVRSGWDDPHGHRHGAIYGLKVAGTLFRLDVIYDPVAEIKRHLPA